jgi:MFS family permease
MTSDSPSISTIVRANPRGWLIVLFIFGALGLVFSARMMLSVAMPTWEAELGWARTFISSGGSVVLVFMTLISPLAGNLLDKVGPRPVVAGALLCVGASLAATSCSASSAGLATARLQRPRHRRQSARFLTNIADWRQGSRRREHRAGC